MLCADPVPGNFAQTTFLRMIRAQKSWWRHQELTRKNTCRIRRVGEAGAGDEDEEDGVGAVVEAGAWISISIENVSTAQQLAHFHP